MDENKFMLITIFQSSKRATKTCSESTEFGVKVFRVRLPWLGLVLVQSRTNFISTVTLSRVDFKCQCCSLQELCMIKQSLKLIDKLDEIKPLT